MTPPPSRPRRHAWMGVPFSLDVCCRPGCGAQRIGFRGHYEYKRKAWHVRWAKAEPPCVGKGKGA